MVVKRYNREDVDFSLEEELARGRGTLDPDGPVIEQNVALCRAALEAAGYDLSHLNLLLDGLRNDDPKRPDVPSVKPVLEVDLELAVQVLRHARDMERVFERATTPETHAELKKMRYHAIRYQDAVRDLQQLGNPRVGRRRKVTWALIDEVEREGWRGEAMVAEVARRAGATPKAVYDAMRARRRK